MKVFFVVGTRPNLIKLSPILSVASSYPKLKIEVVHTGQHYDKNMSHIFFEELGMPHPHYFIEADNSSQARQTASIMTGFEDLCLREKPDGVVVFGDVNSTVSAVLVAAKLHIKTFHIEAGLRSFNKSMPEEINRLIADVVCDVLYAPSENAMLNLKNEGLFDKSLNVGDIMFDAVLKNKRIAQSKSNILNRLGLQPKSYYLATLHRPYNVDVPETLKAITDAFALVKGQVVFSVHPRTLKNIAQYNIKLADNIICTEPLGYFDILQLQEHALKIITDSGGLQKEAYFVQTPCVTLRPETEWIETVETGANTLVPIRIMENILAAIMSKQEADFSQPIYGTGHTAEKILRDIEKRLILQ